MFDIDVRLWNQDSTKLTLSIIPGDPADLSLRKVEEQVLIPKIMRERAKAEKCVDEVKGKVLNYVITHIIPSNKLFVQHFLTAVATRV